MSQAVLISIRPKWCSKIANGEKTIEVRKRQPRLDAPFKVYVYCTHGPDMLWILNPEDRKLFPEKPTDVFTAKDAGGLYPGNGNVIGEFVCDRVTNIFSFGRMQTAHMDYTDGIFQTSNSTISRCRSTPSKSGFGSARIQISVLPSRTARNARTLDALCRSRHSHGASWRSCNERILQWKKRCMRACDELRRLPNRGVLQAP